RSARNFPSLDELSVFLFVRPHSGNDYWASPDDEDYRSDVFPAFEGPASRSPPGREFGERNQAAFLFASASASTPMMSLSFMMRYSTPSILTSGPGHFP